jgi:hypothetical protein
MNTGSAPQAERLEIPAQALRERVIYLFNTIGNSPEERAVFLRSPQEYLARLLSAERACQTRLDSIDAILAALAQSAELAPNGPSTTLAQLVRQAFSTNSLEPPTRGEVPDTARDTPYSAVWNSEFSRTVTTTWTWTYTYTYTYTYNVSGATEGDTCRSPAHLRAALEAYASK